MNSYEGSAWYIDGDCCKIELLICDFIDRFEEFCSSSKLLWST